MRRLILNESLPNGLFAVLGESSTLCVLDWRGQLRGQSWAVRIPGNEGLVGRDDNTWLRLMRLSSRNPDNDDVLFNEVRVGWRHRWEFPYEHGWYDQSSCASIEAVTAGQVEGWLIRARSVVQGPVSSAMDPVEGVSAEFRSVLRLDTPPGWP